jgi:hypothetical protein
VLTVEDYLPFLPLLALVAASALLWLYDTGLRAAGLPATVSALPLVLVEIAIIFHTHSPAVNETRDKIGMVADTLRLTDADDFVMDSKGETIYRRRPFFYVLERMTLARLKDGNLQNDIAQRLIDTRTPLVTLRRMPEATRRFMKENYVAIAYRLRVLGQDFPGRSGRSREPIVFQVNIPARYSFVKADGPVAGALDGREVTGPCELTAGRHEFLPPPETAGKIIMVWSQALERGYSPFAPIQEDLVTPQD